VRRNNKKNNDENYSSALLRLVRALNQTNIEYALTGAAAVGYYGMPRSSMDIDVILKTPLTGNQIDRLVDALSKNGFTVRKEEVQDAVKRQIPKFQAFDNKTGFLRVDGFFEEAFERVPDHMDGLQVWFRSFEEFIVKKIQYGDLEEVKSLLQRRGKNYEKTKIFRLLTSKQKEMFEKIAEET
jgi:hypothetical protein